MEEKRYTIIKIAEDDCGCEDRPDDYVPMVRVLVRSIESENCGVNTEKVIMMEDALMYARNLDEGNEAVIGSDGGLYPIGMLCNEEKEENVSDIDTINRQNEWLEAYLDAVEEMNKDTH